MGSNRKKIARMVTCRSLYGVRHICAATLDDIFQGLDGNVYSKSQGISVSLDDQPGFNEWEWSVKDYTVRVRAELTDVQLEQDSIPIESVDLKVSCSCPYWQWQGPEYHGQQEDYLLGSPRGTATEPNERDPEGVQKLCKHATAVLNEMRRTEIEPE